MPRKENTKAKTWERDRRSRMNAYFNALAELLPPQQDGRKRNKVDILVHATKYIKDLHSRTDDLMQANASTAHKEELGRLKKLITQLFSRMQLLSNLLQDAGITVPAEPALEKISPLKWSNKINVNTVETYLNTCDKKSNNEKKQKVTKNKGSKSKNVAKKLKTNNETNQENQENRGNAENDKKEENIKDSTQSVSDSKEETSKSESNNVKEKDPKTITLAKPPDKIKKVKLKRKRNEAFKIPTTTVGVNNFPTGTLVLSGTKIMPVMTPIPSLTPNIIMSTQPRPSSSPIILNNAQPSQMFVVQPLPGNSVRNSVISIQNQAVINAVPDVNFGTNMIVNSRTWASNVKTIINATKIGGHKGILPKGRENTKTTMTYKVPIPAIHKEKHDKKDKDKDLDSKCGSTNKKQTTEQEECKKNNVDAKEKGNRKRSLVKDDAKENLIKKKKVEEKNNKTESSEILVTCQSIENLKNVIDKIGEEENNDKKEAITKKTFDDQDKVIASNKLENKEKTIEDKTEQNDKTKESEIVIDNSENVVPPLEKEKETQKEIHIEPDKRELQIKETNLISDSVNEVCNLGGNFENLLQSSNNEIVNETLIAESNKILLNLDTNTTTTMKLETSSPSSSTAMTVTTNESSKLVANLSKNEDEVKHLSYSTNNTFVPINKSEALHSDLSNDIFASLQVPSSSHNPESISPTVAFLTAFPLVSSLSGKTVVLEDEMKDDFNHSQTPPMLLQIGAIEPNSFKIKSSDNIDSNSKTVVPRSESKSAEIGPTKVLPKIISNETIKESYKIVQTSSTKVQNHNEPIDMNITNNVAKSVINPRDVTNATVSSTASLKNVNINNNEPLTTVNIDTGVENVNEFGNGQNKNQPLENFQVSKDSGINTCDASSSVSVLAESTRKFDNQRYNETCHQNICQVECSKDDAVRNNHYDYQVCSLENYNSRNNGIPETTFENLREDYIVRNKTTFSNTESIETNCTNVNKSLLEQQSSRTVNQNDKLSGNLHSQPVSENTNENLSSQKKINTADYQQQNLPYGDSSDKRKNILSETNKNSGANITETRNSNYQRRSNESQQSYVDPFSCKGGKKIIPNSSNNSNNNNKSVPIRSSYSQQQDSFSTSNYDENSISRQTTTTVAHNTSNFSILSWTTFSPVNNNANNNNNNQIPFEQSAPQSNLNQPKPICENINYLPIHKENSSVPNIIVTQSFTQITNTVNYDKSRTTKQPIEVQKRSYNDPSKNRNIRPVVSSQKQNRNQTQNQVPSSSEYNKFNTEANNKNKVKYPTELDYIQNDFLNIDPRQQQIHHQQKNSSQSIQNVNKQDKSNYIIADFDPQNQFDSEQNNPRYNSDIYVSSNFKTQQLSTQKNYQVQSQTQIPQHGQQQQQQTGSKQKSQSQQSQQQIRPPVNWMMTPEMKHPNTSNIGDIILPPIGKELEFCQNNFFSQTPTYNQSAPNQFYNNYDVTTHGFPNIPVLQGDPKRGTDSSTFYSEEQPFSWSPTKNVSQSVEQSQALKGIEQHVVPTTLPTLVGDLALGTNLPEKQNFLFPQNSTVRNELGKDTVKEKESNREYQMLNTQQNVQHPTQGMSFLSVSQLVEQEKVEKNQQHNHHHQQQQQQQHQQQQQSRKHQRKNNTSPRGGKKQMDLRKQSINQHQDEQKTTAPFSDQNYQQAHQKYQQNDIHWRARNCKSNYTAEALIGNDGNNQDKNPKYNYPQNKFPGGLHSSDPMMPINYFPNVDNTGGYGQVVNQNFNHSYTYSSNANIYPNTNFITSISNTPANYMMSLHENPDYLETNNFLLPPNVATSTTSLANPSINSKNQHFPPNGKHNQNCDKRTYLSTPKKSKRKAESSAQNFDFPLSGITSPLDDYHHTTFLQHATPLYQNHGQVNVYPKSMNALAPPPPPAPPPPAPAPPSSALSLPPSSSQGLPIPAPTSGIPAANPMVMHHASGTSLTNFNLTTIFPEMNDKVSGYKPSTNGVPTGLIQSSHASTSYPQRVSYTNSLGHIPQVSESTHFTSDLLRPSTSEIVHYKNP